MTRALALGILLPLTLFAQVVLSGRLITQLFEASGCENTADSRPLLIDGSVASADE